MCLIKEKRKYQRKDNTLFDDCNIRGNKKFYKSKNKRKNKELSDPEATPRDPEGNTEDTVQKSGGSL